MEHPIDMSTLPSRYPIICQKLDSLTQGIHQLQVQSHALKEGEDSAQLVSSSTGDCFKTSTPMTSRFHTTTKWASMDPQAKLDVMRKVTNEHTRVVIDFDCLAQALLQSAKASALHKALTASSDNSESQSADPEEQEYVKGLLDEASELSERLLEMEEEDLALDLDLIKAKSNLLAEFSSSNKLFDELVKAKEAEEVTQTRGGLTHKHVTLVKEQKKLIQMRTMIQKLVMLQRNCGFSLDDDLNQQIRDMLEECGQVIDPLAAGNAQPDGTTLNQPESRQE